LNRPDPFCFAVCMLACGMATAFVSQSRPRAMARATSFSPSPPPTRELRPRVVSRRSRGCPTAISRPVLRGHRRSDRRSHRQCPGGCRHNGRHQRQYRLCPPHRPASGDPQEVQPAGSMTSVPSSELRPRLWPPPSRPIVQARTRRSSGTPCSGPPSSLTDSRRRRRRTAFFRLHTSRLRRPSARRC
jgi:hypothetical protein